MSNHLKAKVGNNFEFDINSEDISELDIVETSDATYHLLHQNTSYTAKVTASNFNKKHYQVSINNNVYNVAISDGLDLLIDKMGFTSGAKKVITSINAPMPGLLIEMSVKEGQEVKENDSLFILEAMKMENSITSPIDGVIKAIHSKKGDAVEKNQILIEFEN